MPEPDANPAAEAEYGGASMQAETTRLMTAVKQGDREAFDELVHAVRGRAFRVARSLVGSHDDALELAQETFLKVFRARDSYREGEPFLPWFHRILRNTCISFLRERGRVRRRSLSAPRPGAEDDEGDWELEGTEPEPTEHVERDERARLFWAAFETLSARDREIVALRHFDELSYKELALALDIPIGTVMSRLFHARRRLREQLEGHVDEALFGAAAGAAGRTSGERGSGGRTSDGRETGERDSAERDTDGSAPEGRARDGRDRSGGDARGGGGGGADGPRDRTARLAGEADGLETTR